MKKGKLIKGNLGLVLVFVLIEVMLGGFLVAPSPLAERASHSQALAQGTSELEWSKAFGGPADDFGESVHQTSDGGYIVAGYTKSFGAGGYDVWLIKTNSNGNRVWDKTFGGNSTDTGSSVRQTSDGGYVAVGGTNSYGAGGYDVWLIKTDSNGNKVWDKTFGGTSDDAGSSVQQTSDGGYVVAGYTISFGVGGAGVWLIKTDSNGDKVWDKTYGGTSTYDMGASIQQTSDGGYVVVGYTNSFGAGGYDVWLIKIDSNCNRVWDKTFGGNSTDTGSSVRQTSDGGYLIVGQTNSYGAGGYDVWLIKTDPNGNKVWDKTFGGTSDDAGSSVQQTSDGAYIVVGGTGSYGAGVEDVWLIKTDSSGNKVWDKTFGGTSYDFGESIQQTSEGGYVITGTTESYVAGAQAVWLIKLGPEAEVPITHGGTPIWFWIIVAVGTVSLLAIIVYVARRRAKTQHSG